MSKFYTLDVAQVHQETRDTLVATFAVPPALQQRFAFIQGQHLTLRARVDGQDLRRSYSICSAVQDGDLRVAIKRTPGGVFSTWAHAHLQPGVSVEVMPPMGHFHRPLDPANRKRYLALAAGSGITPILSIIKTTLALETGSSFTRVYGNRASSTVIFREALAELKDRYLQRLNLVYVMSREPQDIDLFHGRITREKCDGLFTQWIRVADHDAAFVCGPEDMTRAASDALQANGMAPNAIKVELFAASAPRHAPAAQASHVQGRQQSEITLIIDGQHRSFTMEKDRESVLDAGLKQGIDLRYACKSGVCSTCRCKLREGQVVMDANYALEDYEVVRGFVLACQAFPVTDRVVIDFDQDS